MLAHLPDLRADFLRFFPQFGPDPISQMDGPLFFELAERVSAYGGVMTVRVQQAQQEAEPAPVVPVAGPAGRAADAKVVELSAFQAMFPGAVEKVKVARGA